MPNPENYLKRLEHWWAPCQRVTELNPHLAERRRDSRVEACYLLAVSIYATLWTLKFPKEGDDHLGCEWIEVRAQAVPAHVGSPTPACGYEEGDPYAAFLPPAVATDADGNAPFHRAVIIVTEYSLKGTERSGQEYVSPLLVLTGEQYARASFEELYKRICDALRGNRSPVLMEVLLPDGTHKIIRQKKSSNESGNAEANADQA